MLHKYNRKTKIAYCGEEMVPLTFCWSKTSCPECLKLKPVPYEKEEIVRLVQPEDIDIDKLRAFGKKKGWGIRRCG
jgi:hypothetical protein